MTPWLLLMLICTEPVPPECIGRDPHALLANPVCIAVSKSCEYHRAVVFADAALSVKDQRAVCERRGAEIFAAELLKGYRRGRFPECIERMDEP